MISWFLYSSTVGVTGRRTFWRKHACAFSESASMPSRYRTVDMTPRFPNAPVDGLVAHSCTIYRQQERKNKDGMRQAILATVRASMVGYTDHSALRRGKTNERLQGGVCGRATLGYR